MFGFWIATAVMAAAASALILHRAAGRAENATADNIALEVHRRALIEIEALSEQGLLPPGEFRALRAEVARRLLREAERPLASFSRGAGFIPVFACAAVAAGAFAVYLAVGAPGTPDQPFAARLAQWRAHPETAPPAGLAAALSAVADERPGDIEPLRRLAALDLALGDLDGAAHALRRAMAAVPRRADIPAMLGEVMVIRDQGVVNPDARYLFDQALRTDPGQAVARYYLARARINDGDVAVGLNAWRALLASLPSVDPRRAALASQIATVERTGRLAPEGAQRAAEPPETASIIQGMVDGLATRLRIHPDDPDGWVRLVRAYAVLGEDGKRDQASREARTRYADRPAVLSAIDAAEHVAPANLTPR